MSGSESSGDSDHGRYRKKRGKKNFKVAGLNAKDAGIKIKVKWAQSMLGTMKEINFDDMDLNQFTFWESRLINRNKIDHKEKETSIHLMQRISELSSKFGFEVAKELYRDTLNGIEKKEFKWGNLN